MEILVQCKEKRTAIAHARNDAMRAGGAYVYIWNDTADAIEYAEYVDAQGNVTPVAPGAPPVRGNGR